MGNSNPRDSGDCMSGHNRPHLYEWSQSTTFSRIEPAYTPQLNYCGCGSIISNRRQWCAKCEDAATIKFYCHICSTQLSSGQIGWCSSCERAAEEEEERAMERANDEFETERSKAAKKNNYIHITNNCENETSNLIKPSRFNNKWAGVDYELKLVYQHKKVNNKRVYVWKYCKIYCNAKSHIIFNRNETNWPEPKDSTCNSFTVIDEVLNKKECSECKNEMDKVKAKIDQFETKQDGILNALKERTCTSSQIKLSQIKLSEITKLEIDLNETFKECKEAIESVENIVSESKSIAEEEEGNATYETQIDLDKFTKKAVKKQNEISRQKQNVFRVEKALNVTEKALNVNENEINDELITQKEVKLKLNEQYESVDKLREVLGAIMVNKSEADIAGDEIQKLNEKINELLKLLHERYGTNEQRMDELNECKLRVGVIRKKLEKQKGENKYLLQLLEQEYNRLSTTTESAIKKFEENGIYFLSVRVGLKENIIDKFVESGCDKLDDIKDMNDEDLIEIGIESKIMRKKILKQIHLLNEKFNEWAF
eukprot:364800_1